MVKSPIAWAGGKYRLAEKIVSLFSDHTLYVEVFGGAGHVLFRKPPSRCEIYNDINRSLVCFFTVVKDKEKCGILYEKLNTTPYSRDLFNRCLNNLNLEVISDAERAYSFAVVNKQSFGGLMETWGVDMSRNKTALSFSNVKELLAGACERLNMVQLECKDFRYILKRYDRTNTLFYLDPPYAWSSNRSGRKIYAHELADCDHVELVDILLNLQGKAILSGYDTPLYDRLTDAGWRKVSMGDIAVTLNKKIGEKRIRKQEFVWYNF